MRGLRGFGRLTIRPDLVWYGLDGRPVAVADTNYKLLDDKGNFPNADAYQLVTYCARLGLSTRHLIYAAGDPQPTPTRSSGSASPSKSTQSTSRAHSPTSRPRSTIWHRNCFRPRETRGRRRWRVSLTGSPEAPAGQSATLSEPGGGCQSPARRDALKP